MKQNREYVPEVSLVNLLFHLLRRWRSVVAAGLICAALIGGVRFAHGIIRKQSEEFAEETAKYELDLEIYEKSILDFQSLIESYKSKLKDSLSYSDQSLKMKIDPQSEWVATKNFFVLVDPEEYAALPDVITQDPADVIIGVYSSSLLNGGNLDDLKAELGVDKSEYIRELVSVTADTSTNTFALKVIGNSKELVQTIMEHYSQYMEVVSKAEALQAGKHELVLADETVQTRIDTAIANDFTKMNDGINNLRTGMEKAQQEFQRLKSSGAPKAPDDTGMLKFVIVGFIAGAILMTGIQMMRYLLGGSLRSAKELSEHYGLAVYGVLPRTFMFQPKAGIDRVIERAAQKRDGGDKDLILQQIASVLSKQSAGKHMTLISTVSSQRIEQVSQELQSMLGSKASLSLEQDFLKHKDGIDQLKHADSVILIEIRDYSDLRQIKRLGELLSLADIQVAGCIVL